MKSMGKHKVKVKHFDSLLVKMNSSRVKAEVDYYFLFPSAVSKETVIIHCHILYLKYGICHLKVHIVLVIIKKINSSIL